MLLSLWHLCCIPHGDVHSCEQDCLLAVPMPVIFFASFALERMGVSSDSVGGSHAGYRQPLKRSAMLLYLLKVVSSNQNPFDPAVSSTFMILSTLLNTLDCAGNHALSSHFTGAIVSNALEVSSALCDHHLIWCTHNETRCGIQSISLSNTFETILNVYLPSLPHLPRLFCCWLPELAGAFCRYLNGTGNCGSHPPVLQGK